MQNYVITIARGFGSGGKDVATRLSEALGIPCYDRQILTMASEQYGIDENLFVDVNEKLRGKYITQRLKGIPDSAVLEPSKKNFISDINLYQLQAQLIRELAKTESCIIVGKCADHILQSFGNVISIYIEAPRDYCVRSIMTKMFVTEELAHRMISETDKYRSKYYHFYTGGKNWTNPINYDLIINTGRVGRINAVNVIKDYVGIKLGLTDSKAPEEPN